MNKSQQGNLRKPVSQQSLRNNSQANPFQPRNSQNNFHNSSQEHPSVMFGPQQPGRGTFRKMLKVGNGKIIPAEQYEGQQAGPQGRYVNPSANKSNISVPNEADSFARRDIGTAPNKFASSVRKGDEHSCEAGKSEMENQVDSYINMNDIYYKHIKGLCVCYRCTCGKHRCAWAKNAHLKQPFNQPQQQSIYKLNYVPKTGLKGVDFDYGMYENMKNNTNTIDTRSVNHTDFTKPDQRFYGANPSFKPESHYEVNPPQAGRSHYKRDYLEWGCVPYQPIRGQNQRTTIDAMPFHGLTTYTKDYHLMNCPREPHNNNSRSTMVKSPLPFLGITTSQEFFKPYKDNDRAVRYKASDELATGAPSYKGQFASTHQKDYIDFLQRCPVEIDIERSKLASQQKQ